MAVYAVYVTTQVLPAVGGCVTINCFGHIQNEMLLAKTFTQNE